MRKILNYLTLATAIAMLLMALGPNLSRSTATATDFDAEVRQIEAFMTDFGKFHDQMILLNRKASITPDETKALARERESLKVRLPDVENAFKSIADKLKADGRWDSLDAEVLRTIADAKTKRVIEQGGGARKILEDAQSLVSSADEISDLVRTPPECSTPKACVPNIIAASYDPSAVVFKDSLGCKIARAILCFGPAKARAQARAYCLCIDMPATPGETLSQCMQNTIP